MTTATYKPALALVLAHEGGYVDHILDPGGPTNQGVTQRVYDDYRKVHGSPVQSVKLIKSLEIEEIYRKQYWRLIRGDDLPTGLDYAVFDFAVNSGISRATRYLQIMLGVKDDGIIGNGTLAKCFDFCNTKTAETCILTYCANRLRFLRGLKTFPTFGKGWTRRVIGNIPGAQINDVGVVDAAIKFSRTEPVFVVPKPVGTYPEEIAAKTEDTEENIDSFPMATAEEIKALANSNDNLAKLIEQS